MIKKYIKTYEDIIQSEQDTTRDEPQVGDYVICKNDTRNKFQNYIGRIDVVDKSDSIPYLVTFKELRNRSCWFQTDEILHFSKNKKDLKIYIDTNKYNL